MSRETIVVLVVSMLFWMSAACGAAQDGVKTQAPSRVSIIDKYIRPGFDVELVVQRHPPWHKRRVARMITNAWVSVACFMAFFGLGRSISR